jgi:hypothetical protein
MRIFKSSIAATSAPASPGDQATAPSRSPRPMRSSDSASSANGVSFAMVALPRSARAFRLSASASTGLLVALARASSPSSCSTYSLASRMKKSRKPEAGEVIEPER